MTRVARAVLGGLAGLALVAVSLLVAYAFGGGWLSGVGIWLPTPLNFLGALSIVWAAVHATYVLAVPRSRRTPFTRASSVVTATGTTIVAATAVAAIVTRLV